MDWNSLLDSITADKGLQAQGDGLNAYNAQLSDKLRMKLNPDMQGPPQADGMTPEAKAFADNQMGAMMGSIAPVKAAGAVEEAAATLIPRTAGEQAARQSLDAAVSQGSAMPDVQRLQQNLSRQVDFANRAQQQRFDRLQKIMGRKN